MSNTIYRLFGTSPIRPLQTHMAKVLECVSELIPMIEATLARDISNMEQTQERIAALESEADDLKHQLRLNLPRNFFLPVERRDLLELLTMQDKVANQIKDIAGLIRGRQMEIPESIGDLFLEFIGRTVDACKQAKSAVDELDELVETGFKGTEVDRVEEMINELDRIEKDTDILQVKVRSQLFSIERDLPPINAMFLYRLIDWVGETGDLAQRVGSRLQVLLAR